MYYNITNKMNVERSVLHMTIDTPLQNVAQPIPQYHYLQLNAHAGND